MKLYHSTSSPNSRRVRVFVAEKGISIPLEPVNLGEKEQFSDWFKAINPRRQVPALVLDDGTTVAEVPAIWRFLEETYPEHPLLGSDATSRALVTMWERRAELDGFAPTMEGVRNAAAGLKGRALSGPHDYDQIPELVERSKRRVADFYADFDTHLEQVPFVAGAAFSAADITALVTVDFATAALKMSIPDGSRAVQRWYETVAARPSARA
ncbi:glutathione S-transferase family protein [Mesorhizobium sp. LjNodule214]|uniref:glutathione S-transferase family protein n=1 Tax=Mesorhizobium sp. LjNodule214 TaxID=3342252 RepID=UPI003ECE331F